MFELNWKTKYEDEKEKNALATINERAFLFGNVNTSEQINLKVFQLLVFQFKHDALFRSHLIKQLKLCLPPLQTIPIRFRVLVTWNLHETSALLQSISAF